MRNVIVNSTPIISLAKTNCLYILQELYGHITIPEAVFNEVTFKDDTAKAMLLKNSEWIKVSHITDTSEKSFFKSRLHDGEVEVMILAREINADLVIIDDYAARKTAEYLGLTLTGTLGILIKAKKLGIIQKVMPIIQKMEFNGIYYSEQLKNQIRHLTNETDDNN